MAVFRSKMPSRAKKFRKGIKARSAWTSRRAITANSNETKFRSYVPRTIGNDYGFPDKLVTTLRYVDTIRLTGAAGVPGANTFRMNSLNDPDLSGVGHQPMYYDQLCGASGTAPYSRYRVLGSKITVKYMIENAPSLAAANLGPVLVGLQTGTTSGLFGANASALLEASGSVWTYLGDKSGGNNVKTLSASFIPTRDLGLDQGDDTISAGATANPSQVFHAVPWKIDTVGAAVVVALVQLEFRCEFFARNEVAQS